MWGGGLGWGERLGAPPHTAHTARTHAHTTYPTLNVAAIAQFVAERSVHLGNWAFATCLSQGIIFTFTTTGPVTGTTHIGTRSAYHPSKHQQHQQQHLLRS